MNFVSKIPKLLLVAISAVVGFTFIYLFVIGSVHLRPPLSMSLTLFIIFINFLPGIVSAIIAWFGMRKTHRNAWAIAIITGFAMLALFLFVSALIGPILGYVALLPITWGLLVVINRVFSNSKHTVLTFCVLFILCVILLVVGRRFATWIFDMRSAAYYYSSREF